MRKKGVDILLASSPENVFYTSGFPVSLSATNRILWILRGVYPAFTVIPRIGEPTLIVRSASAEIARDFSWIKDQRYYTVPIYIERTPDRKVKTFAKSALDALKRILEEKGASEGRVGIEEESVSLSFFEVLRRSLPKAMFVNADDAFRELRSIKSPDEISKIRKATEITEKAIEVSMNIIRPGVTEIELVRKLKQCMIEEGADWAHTQIAAGPYNSATPSWQPTDYKVKRGDVVMFDVGAVYEGYCSDIGRVAVLGGSSEKLATLYEISRQASEKAVEAVRPGVRASEIYRIGQQMVQERGYPKSSRGFLGHGVGINVHEEPRMAPDAEGTIEEGMVFTVEPGIYIPGWGGVRLEDMVVVTAEGCEMLTYLPKSLISC